MRIQIAEPDLSHEQTMDISAAIATAFQISPINVRKALLHGQ